MKKTLALWMVFVLALSMTCFVASAEDGTEERNKIVVEYENYNESFNTIGTVCTQENEPGNLASGGGYLYWDTNHLEEDLQAEFSVSVPESGLYAVSLIASKISGCFPKISIDGLDVLDSGANKGTVLDQIGKDGKYPYYNRPFFAAIESPGKTIYLTAGEHSVSTYVPRRNLKEGEKIINDVAVCLDSLTFAPADTVSVSPGETWIEYEDFAGMFNTIGSVRNLTNTPGNLASGGGYVYWDTGYLQEDIRIDIPVTVERGGIYDLSVIASRVGSYPQIFVDGNIMFDGTKKGGTAVDEKGEDEVYPYFAKKIFGALDHTATFYLSQGTHVLSTGLTRRTFQESGAEMRDVASCIDRIKLVRIKAPAVQVSAEGESKAEFEDYQAYTIHDNRNIKKGSVKEYEKGTTLNLTEIVSAEGFSLEIPLIVEKTGWYYMDAVLSKIVSNWTSVVTISVNGKPILQNKDPYTVEDLSLAEDGETIDYVSDSYKMHRFRGECFLEAGEQTLTYYAAKRIGQTESDMKLGVHRVCAIADSIRFTPIKDTVTQTADTVSVKVYFNEPLTGKLIMALYDGYDMVGLSFQDVSEDYIIEAEAAYTKSPGIIKLLVWDNFSEMNPTIKQKILELQ